MRLVRQAAVTGFGLKASPYFKRFSQAGRAGRLILKNLNLQEISALDQAQLCAEWAVKVSVVQALQAQVRLSLSCFWSIAAESVMETVSLH